MDKSVIYSLRTGKAEQVPKSRKSTESREGWHARISHTHIRQQQVTTIDRAIQSIKVTTRKRE